jgi:hypothetical protein
MSAETLHRRLRQLIGEYFDYLGEVWVLIEVLGDDDSVVLRRCSDCAPRNVQRNAYGIPSRRAQETLTLPISDTGGEGYSEDILILLEGRRAASDGS